MLLVSKALHLRYSRCGVGDRFTIASSLVGHPHAHLAISQLHVSRWHSRHIAYHCLPKRINSSATLTLFFVFLLLLITRAWRSVNDGYCPVKR